MVGVDEIDYKTDTLGGEADVAERMAHCEPQAGTLRGGGEDVWGCWRERDGGFCGERESRGVMTGG